MTPTTPAVMMSAPRMNTEKPVTLHSRYPCGGALPVKDVPAGTSRVLVLVQSGSGCAEAAAGTRSERVCPHAPHARTTRCRRCGHVRRSPGLGAHAAVSYLRVDRGRHTDSL